MAFNDYGINKSLAGYVLNQFETDDFSLSEISRTIDSAYSNTHNFGTKYYEDEEAINNIKQSLRRGVPKKEIRHQLEESDLDGCNNRVRTHHRVEEENTKQVFWSKNDKGSQSRLYTYCSSSSWKTMASISIVPRVVRTMSL